MKNSILILLSVFLIQATCGQSFLEVCQNSTTNGVMVDCEHFNERIYSTGFFSTICGGSTGFIAEWENDEWIPSDISINDPGHSLRVIDNKLYIAKYEESIDSNWVFVYDNGSLDKLGKGVYLTTASGLSQLPNIYDIVEYNGSIIACGEFDRVGDEDIQGIMQWDGQSWSSLGTGLSGNINNTGPVIFPHQLMVHDSELYIVGNFKNAGGIESNGVAKWNGSEWMSMGAGFNNTVYSIAVFEGDIIAGGAFTESNGVSLDRIAKWDGSAWIPMEFGFSQPSELNFIFVHTIKEIDGILYIAGGLKEIVYPDQTSEPCNGIIAYQDGEINTFMGGVPNNDIEAICKTDDGHLLIGGGVFGTGYMGISDEPLSISVSIDQISLSVFPNPFQDKISIEADIDFNSYEILNHVGQSILEGAFSRTISLDLLPGTYFLKLNLENGNSLVYKLFKR